MLSLVQAATMPPAGPTWQHFAVVAFGLLEVGVLWWMKESSKDRTQIRDTVAEMRGEISALNTHVGVDGNGIIARLDEMNRKLDRLAEEMAESRGRTQHIRTKGD